MERTDSWERPMTRWSPVPVLAAYYDAVTVICELAAQFSDRAWHQPTPCDDWRAADLAGHLRCMADDYHAYPSARRCRTAAGPSTSRRSPSRPVRTRAGSGRSGTCRTTGTGTPS